MSNLFKGKTTVGSNIFAGLTGGFVFSLFFLFLNIPIFASLSASAISYIAGLFIFSKAKEKYELQFKTNPVDEKATKKTLLELKEKLDELKAHSASIKDSHIKNKTDEIVKVIQRMYSNFEKDPTDIKRARQFILYYLESTVKIVRLYVELSAQGANSKDVKNALVRGESVLDVILQAFQVQHSRLLSDDVMDFNVEIEVLEKTLKLESME